MANYRSTNRHGLEIRPTTAIHEGVNKPRGSAEWGGFAEGRRGIAIIRARLRAITRDNGGVGEITMDTGEGK